jgi:hypothetical protein
MEQGSITINPEKIRAKIAWHEEEADRLRGFLDDFDRFKEFAEPSSNGKSSRGPGRPPKANTIEKKLRQFISAQSGEFSNIDMRNSLGGSIDKVTFGTAVRKIVASGDLKVLTQPMGRRPGRYKKAEVNQ